MKNNMDKLLSESELQLRFRLGIPADAPQVMIFTESSHWDPDWLKTADEYYSEFVQSNMDEAILELEKESRRVYGIECIFFLRMYWDKNPEKQDRVRQLINSGQMRLTGSGVTTADTLLPDSEAIFRDFLIGQEWLRKNGLEAEPDLAYFTDSFGCTPALPSLLNAAGFNRTAITRVDGMYFMACDLESSKHFPRKATSAEGLLKEERSLDFIWRDSNGAEVLCHWNAFTYGQADMFAHWGIGRIYMAHFAIPIRSAGYIARQIKTYARQLSPLSRTPYMCSPIGFDFVEPIVDLVSLLDRYNQKNYPKTGIWAVNAGLDDYLALVDCHRDELPVVNLDPNPYWTGFYTARPLLKKQCRDLTDKLLLAESKGIEDDIFADLEAPWWTSVVSNHHDFITGTSPDRVVEEEQIPWLEKAAAETDSVLARLGPESESESESGTDFPSLSWNRDRSRIRITSPFYTVELDEQRGGGISAVISPEGKNLLPGGISNDLVSYRDSGGLWRMGMEFAGGKWKESQKASSRFTEVEIFERGSEIEALSRVELDGAIFTRRMWVSSVAPVLRCRVEGMAPEKYSVTLRLETGLQAKLLAMDAPGGIVERPLSRFYNPTFWPLHGFMHTTCDESGRGLAVIQPYPGAVSCTEDGRVELVAMRNAVKETVLGFIGIPGNPAAGHEREPYEFDYTLVFTGSGGWRENGIHRMVYHSIRDSAVTTDSPDVTVIAVKRASRGEGVILRLYAPFPLESDIAVDVSSLGPGTGRAFLCDVRERDIEPLEVLDGKVHLNMMGSVATLRLLPG